MSGVERQPPAVPPAAEAQPGNRKRKMDVLPEAPLPAAAAAAAAEADPKAEAAREPYMSTQD